MTFNYQEFLGLQDEKNKSKDNSAISDAFGQSLLTDTDKKDINEIKGLYDIGKSIFGSSSSISTPQASEALPSMSESPFDSAGMDKSLAESATGSGNADEAGEVGTVDTETAGVSEAGATAEGAAMNPLLMFLA